MPPYLFYLQLITRFRNDSGIELTPVSAQILHIRLKEASPRVRQYYMRWMEASFQVSMNRARFDPESMGLHLLSVAGPDPVLFSAIEAHAKQPRPEHNTPP